MSKTVFCGRINSLISQQTLVAFSLVSTLIPEKSAWSENASMMPSSFRVFAREEEAEMENLGKKSSTELKNRNIIRELYNRL